MLINYLSIIKNLFFGKVFFSQLTNMTAGDRIVNKTILQLQNNLNLYTYRCKRNLLAFKPGFCITTMWHFKTNIVNKSVYIDKSLTKSVKSRLELKKWITLNQKKSLIKYVETCQTNLSTLIKQKNCLSKIFYVMELLINGVLFQIHAVETLSGNKESQISGIDNQILISISKSKIKLLSKLKHFKNRKSLPLKWVYIPEEINGKHPISIIGIIDQLIQQLFVLILNPFVETNSDFYSYGFRKGKNQTMVIGTIQKNLQSKLKKNSCCINW